MDTIINYIDLILENGGLLRNDGSDFVYSEIEHIVKIQGFKIATFNIGGICSNFIFLERLLSAGTLGEESLDILNVQETWLSVDSHKIDISIPGFKYKRYDRPINKKSKGGGHLVYFRDSLDIDFDSYSKYNISNDSLELISYRVASLGDSNLQVISAYKPPDAKHSTLEQIIPLLDSLNQNTNVLLTGDLNTNLATHSRGKDLLEEICDTFSLKILNYTHPTHFSKKSSSVLDIIAVSNDLQITNGLIALSTNKPTGHLPVFASFPFEPKLATKNTEIFTRSLKKKFDKVKFSTALNNLNWDQLFNSVDTTEAWNIFSKYVLATLDQLYPLECIKVKKKKKIWINKEASDMLAHRDRLFKKARRTGRQIDLDLAKKYQRQSKNRLTAIKNSFIQSNMYDLKENPSKFWESTTKALKGKFDILGVNCLENKSSLEKEGICNKFNDFFCQVGKNLADTICPLTQTESNILNERFPMNDIQTADMPGFFLREVTPREVYKIVKDMKINKSSGLVNISMHIFKEASLVLLSQLTHIINLSFCNGEFPNEWKSVRVTPLFKGGGTRVDPNYYRPISIVPCISKVIEKLFLTQLNEHLKNCDLLALQQHGFRKGHSIHSAIDKFLSFVMEGGKDDNFVLSTYIDLKKAFDTVNHTMLLNKLNRLFKFQNCAISWITSFLSNRKQFCSFLGTSSTSLINPIGVPQGSILGPTLFSLFINDCPSVLENSNIVLYADDTALLVKDKNVCKAVNIMEDNLYLLHLWLRANKLSLNPNKSKFCIFNVPGDFPMNVLPLTINMGPYMLSQTDCYTYLLGFEYR